MIALLRAKIYPAVRSKSFRIFLAFVLFWTFMETIDLLTDSEAAGNTGFLYLVIFQYYLIALPLGASAWYGMFRVHHFHNNVPFLVYDKKAMWTGLLSAFLINTVLILALTAYCVILSLFSGKGVVRTPASDILKALFVLYLISYARTALTCFFAELTKSRLGGALLGLGDCIGLYQILLIYLQVCVLGLFGIHESTLPLSSYSTYFLIENMAEEKMGVMTMSRTSVPVVGAVLVCFILVFTMGTYLIIRHRDIE